MLVKLARNFFTKSGELFYARNNPNVIGEEHRDALPPDAVIVDGPDRPKPDTTKPDVEGLHPDLVRAVGAALKDETTAQQVDQLAKANVDEAAALDASSKAPNPTPLATGMSPNTTSPDDTREADAAAAAEREAADKAAADASKKSSKKTDL